MLSPLPSTPNLRNSSGAKRKDDITQYAKDMLSKSMLTGVPQIVSAPTIRSKVFKTVVFLGSVTGFLYQTSAFLVIYFSYPTLVDVQVTTPAMVDIPSITICNRNGIRRTEYCRLKPRNCIPLKKELSFCEHHPEACVQNSSIINLMYPNKEALEEEASVTQDFLFKAGHESFPLVSKCIFKGANVTFDLCNHSAFKSFIFQDLYGKMKKCYILNARWSQASLNLPQVPTRTTLTIILDLEPEEYFRTDRIVAGQLAVHSPWNILNPFFEGFTVVPRKNYILHIRENIYNLLPHPYQTNCTDYIATWKRRGRNGPLSKEMCIEECILNQTMDDCNCVLTENLYPHNFNFCGEGKAPLQPNGPKVEDWSLLKQKNQITTDKCTEKVNYTECFVKCSPACHARQFEVDINVEDVMEGTGDLDINWNRTSVLNIIFKRTQVNNYRYRAKYESIELFSFLGGFIGIWLGISLVAVLDFVESLSTFIVFVIERLKKTARISSIKSAIGARLRGNSTFSEDTISWARNVVITDTLKVPDDRRMSLTNPGT